MTWLWSVLSAALVLGCVAGPAAAQRRVALVVAIDSYKFLRPLDNAVRDGKAMAALLGANGFEVSAYYNLDLSGLVKAVESFRANARGAEQAVIYYAGHGMEVDGRNIVAPSDLEADCATMSWRGTVGLDTLFQAIRDAPRQAVLLDACRDAPIPACGTRGSSGMGFRNLGELARPGVSVMIANSTLPGAVASDGQRGQHSPFARSLIDRMTERPTAPLRDVLDLVAADVEKATGGRQTPEVIVRGVAPRICLSGQNCGVAPVAVSTARTKDDRDRQFEAEPQPDACRSQNPPISCLWSRR